MWRSFLEIEIEVTSAPFLASKYFIGQASTVADDYAVTPFSVVVVDALPVLCTPLSIPPPPITLSLA